MSEQVSLCFLTYNRLGVVRRCFKSMKEEFDNPNIQKVIWDNASTDGTADWLLKLAEAYPNVLLICSAQNVGVAGGRHEMFPMATGDIIISLDSDVIARKKNWMQPLISTLNDKPDVGLVGAMGFHIPHNWKGLIRAKEGYAECDVLSGFCHAFRRASLEDVSIDTEFNFAGVEDDDFCLQFRALGKKVVQANVPLWHHFSGTWVHSAESYLDNRQRLHKKWEGTFVPTGAGSEGEQGLRHEILDSPARAAAMNGDFWEQI